jgi:hypothetical protein
MGLAVAIFGCNGETYTQKMTVCLSGPENNFVSSVLGYRQ